MKMRKNNQRMEKPSFIRREPEAKGSLVEGKGTSQKKRGQKKFYKAKEKTNSDKGEHTALKKNEGKGESLPGKGG